MGNNYLHNKDKMLRNVVLLAMLCTIACTAGSRPLVANNEMTLFSQVENFLTNVMGWTPGDHYPLCLLWPRFSTTAVSTDKPIEISKYLGVWYEHARTQAAFQKGRCSYAYYTQNKDNAEVIDVYNAGEDPEYPDEKITGTATLEHED